MDGDEEDQEKSGPPITFGRVPLSRKEVSGRIPTSRPLLPRRRTPSWGFYFLDTGERTARADKETGEAGQSPGVHEARLPGRTKPLEPAIGRMETTRAEVSG